MLSTVNKPPLILSSSWYRRWRTLVSISFLLMVVLTFFMQNALAEGPLRTLTDGVDVTIVSYLQPIGAQLSSHPLPVHPLPSHPLTSIASTRIVRVDSADRNQYYTDYQWQVWSYSSCSGISMEVVMNSYGKHLIAADVLQTEQRLGVWNTELGLLSEEGIATTATYFGFDTSANHTRTLQDIVALGNKGIPVIVGVRDDYYYPGGHFFVVRGGDKLNVFIVDSSRANFQRMSYGMFLGIWQGFSAVLTPKQ